MTGSNTAGIVTCVLEVRMSEQKAARVTIYLPRHLLDFADRLAKEMCTSRSDVIAGLLRSEEEAAHSVAHGPSLP